MSPDQLLKLTMVQVQIIASYISKSNERGFTCAVYYYKYRSNVFSNFDSFNNHSTDFSFLSRFNVTGVALA